MCFLVILCFINIKLSRVGRFLRVHLIVVKDNESETMLFILYPIKPFKRTLLSLYWRIRHIHMSHSARGASRDLQAANIEKPFDSNNEIHALFKMKLSDRVSLSVPPKSHLCPSVDCRAWPRKLLPQLPTHYQWMNASIMSSRVSVIGIRGKERERYESQLCAGNGNSLNLLNALKRKKCHKVYLVTINQIYVKVSFNHIWHLYFKRCLHKSATE